MQVNSEMDDIKNSVEAEPTGQLQEKDPNQISFAQADATLDSLMQKFTRDEHYQDVLDARHGVAEGIAEKPKKGKVRGALIPLAASGAGIGAGYLFNSNAYKIGKTAAEVTGVASSLFDSLALVEKFSPIGIATLGAGIASLTASGIRRAFGENIFDYYARYSHLDADGNLVTKPLKKIFNLYARGLEHAAFNTFIINPANPDGKVLELIETANDPEFDRKVGELNTGDKENMVAKGYIHMVASDATEYFGSEFSQEEREKISAYKTQVQNAITQLKSTVDVAQKAEFEKQVYEKVINEEKLRYLLATGLTASISGLKAFAFGSVFSAVQDFILPRFFPAIEKVQQTEMPAEVPVDEASTILAHSKATQPVGIESGASIPDVVGGSVPATVPSADILRPAGEISELPDAVASTPIVAETAKITEVPVSVALPKLEVTGIESALDTLPSISVSGVIEGAKTVESILTFDQGLGLLITAAAENPASIEVVVGELKANPDLAENLRDVFGSLGNSAPEIINGIRSMGPSGMYVLNKILQALACAGSLSTGGVACPALAGP